MHKEKCAGLTIVMPLYNAEDHIDQAITSIKEQTCQDWHCIIVDDDSTDRSMAKVLSSAGKDNRFTILKRASYSSRRGANTCRNIGWHAAESGHVLFMDADDFLSRECLEQRMNVIQQDNFRHQLYIFKTAFVNDEGKVTGYFFNPNTEFHDIVFRFVKHQIPWHTMSPVWSVDLLRKINGWNEEYERLQDVELHIRALLLSPKVFFSSAAADSYYRHSKMTPQKAKHARMGFTRLTKDYYERLVSYYSNNAEYQARIHSQFEGLLEHQFLSYLQSANEKNTEWEEMYLHTLGQLHIAEEEIAQVKHVFSKI